MHPSLPSGLNFSRALYHIFDVKRAGKSSAGWIPLSSCRTASTESREIQTSHSERSMPLPPLPAEDTIDGLSHSDRDSSLNHVKCEKSIRDAAKCIHQALLEWERRPSKQEGQEHFSNYPTSALFLCSPLINTGCCDLFSSSLCGSNMYSPQSRFIFFTWSPQRWQRTRVSPANLIFRAAVELFGIIGLYWMQI